MGHKKSFIEFEFFVDQIHDGRLNYIDNKALDFAGRMARQGHRDCQRGRVRGDAHERRRTQETAPDRIWEEYGADRRSVLDTW